MSEDSKENATLYSLNDLLDILEENNKQYFEVTSKMLQAYGASLYPLDLMGISIAKRSLSLTRGFIEMIKQENFICAAPLLRLQLDNSLRFYAAFLVDKPHDLASRFAQGESIRNFKERGTKQRLTDRLLVERLAEHYPWIIEVYERTSGYIHLSDMHLFNAMGKQKENPKAGIVISEKDAFITEQDRSEAVYTMFRLSQIVLWLLNSWTLTKDTPDHQKWKKKHGDGKGYKK